MLAVSGGAPPGGPGGRRLRSAPRSRSEKPRRSDQRSPAGYDGPGTSPGTARGTGTFAREVSGAAGPVLLGGPNPGRGGPATGLESGSTPRPTQPGAGAAASPARPPWSGVVG